MSKRQKFIFTSFISLIGMILIPEVDIEYRYLAIFVLSLLNVILSLWSLKEALAGIRWLMTIILPVLFTASVGLFYFLLPQSWLSRIPIAILYAIGMYALLLTENIFSVAAIRTIQLFRAAQAVGFLLTLFTGFLLFDTLFSFKLPYWTNSIIVFVFSFPLFLQGLWSINLDERFTLKLLSFTFILSLGLAEIAFILSFWPLTTAIMSLAITTLFYVFLGVTQADLQDRLFKQTTYEYLGVGILILLILIFTTHWGI